MSNTSTSWQERYKATEVYTLRCKIADKPGMLAQVIGAIGGAAANVGKIDVIGVDGLYKVRDITIFCKDKAHLDEVMLMLNRSDNIEVSNVIDEVMEIHRRGTIEIVSRTPINSVSDLRMVYTPGVAASCKVIEADPEKAWEYTGICDRVSIVTDGTAVLGLGDIGTLASLPVMEGKAAILAEFAKVSAIPMLVETKNPDEIIDIVMKTHKSYGAIQLEDIAAPACFEIEDRLKEMLDKPVFHDDQHGTAVVCLAALINSLKMTGRKAKDSNVIMIGSGAAGNAIAKILLDFGVNDIIVFDSGGAVHEGRTAKMDPYKEKLAKITNKNNYSGSFEDAFEGKDIFIGVARPGLVSQDMIKKMNQNPIVFPLSNPIGEITCEEALEAGAAVTADGRSLNNALAFPGIFRGALDVRATDITNNMKIAAATKLAEIAPEGELLPDMIDRNVHVQVANAVANAWLAEQNG